MNEIQRAGNVGVDDADYFIEVLIQKTLSQPDAGVGEQGIDLSSFGRCIQGLDPLNRGKVGFNRLYICSHIAEMLGRRFDLFLIGRNDEVKAIFGAASRKLVAYARGRAGNNGERAITLVMEWFSCRSLPSTLSLPFRSKSLSPLLPGTFSVKSSFGNAENTLKVAGDELWPDRYLRG